MTYNPFLAHQLLLFPSGAVLATDYCRRFPAMPSQCPTPTPAPVHAPPQSHGLEMPDGLGALVEHDHRTGVTRAVISQRAAYFATGAAALVALVLARRES